MVDKLYLCILITLSLDERFDLNYKMISKIKTKEICDVFNSINPNPKIELEYINNFTLLIAILMSAQTTDKMVNRCTRELFKVCKTPYDVLQMTKTEFIDYIKYIGMYRNKTNFVFSLSHKLIQDHNGNTPDKFEDLVKLPGVGPKTANVFLNSAFGKSTIGVDRHILRIVPKIGIGKGTTPEEIMKLLESRVPKKYHRQIHHWLVLHGRYICMARKQKCNSCPIAHLCEYNLNKLKQKREIIN